MGGWVSNKNKKKRIATSSSPLFPSYRFASSFCLQHRSPWLVLLLLLCSRRCRLILLQLHHRTALHCGLIVQHVLYGISLFHCFRRPLGSRSSCLQDWRDKKVHSTNWRKKVMPILYFFLVVHLLWQSNSPTNTVRYFIFTVRQTTKEQWLLFLKQKKLKKKKNKGWCFDPQPLAAKSFDPYGIFFRLESFAVQRSAPLSIIYLFEASSSPFCCRHWGIVGSEVDDQKTIPSTQFLYCIVIGKILFCLLWMTFSLFIYFPILCWCSLPLSRSSSFIWC